MSLTLADKKVVVEEVAAFASKAVSAVVADYRGLTVNQMTQLRAQARAKNVYVRVIRNTLTKRAFQDTDLACLNEKLVGPVIVALSLDSPGDAARLLKDFAKSADKLQVRALSVGAQVYGVEHLEAVASLPTYEEAISKLLYVMKAPIEKFVRTMAEPHAKLVRLLAAVKDTKQ